MTRNQIEYLNYLEQKRSNLAKERETHRANVAAEGIKDRTLEETRRYNIVSQAEVQRSNLARESENLRHNIATESLSGLQLQETERSNRANEIVRQQTVAEAERSNRANEVIGQVRNAENERTNRANEVIRQVGNEISLSQYREAVRHNYAQEAIGRTQASASLTQASAASLNSQANYTNAQAGLTMSSYQMDKDQIVLNEQERHNKVMEAIQMYAAAANSKNASDKNVIDLFKAGMGAVTQAAGG